MVRLAVVATARSCSWASRYVYPKKASAPRATTPEARPSNPSTKLTALAHTTMNRTVMRTDVVVPRAMMEFGSGIQNIRTPPVTTIPAAST